MSLTNFWRSCAAVATAMTLAGAASAQTVFFSDNFNSYAEGAVLDTDTAAINNGPGPWDAHSSAATGPIAVSGGKAVLLQGGTGLQDVHRDAGQGQTPGTTWYYSAKFTVTDTRTDPLTNFIAPVYFMHFMEDLTDPDVVPASEQMFRGRLYVLPGTAQDKFTLGLSSGTKTLAFPTDADFDADNDVDGRDFIVWQRNYGLNPAANNTGDADNNMVNDDADFEVWKDLYGYYTAERWGTDLTFGQIYQVVVSYTAADANAGTTTDGFASLWVDPVNSSSTSITDDEPNANIVNDATRPMKQLAMRQGTNAFQNGPTRIDVDSVAIGNNFGDVLAGLNPSAAAVPEPASWALAAFLACAAAGRRRGRGAI